MKKRIFILGVIVGVLLTSTIGYAAYKYKATEVGYTPSNSNFDVDNVSDAIKELYNKIDNDKKDGNQEEIDLTNFNMTSASNDWVSVSSSSIYNSGYKVWGVYSDNAQFYWASGSGAGNWHKIEFKNSVKITRINMKFKSVTVATTYRWQYSNDNSTWYDLTDNIVSSINSTSDDDFSDVTISDIKEYDGAKYYRLYIVNSTFSDNGRGMRFYPSNFRIRLYGYYLN